MQKGSDGDISRPAAGALWGAPAVVREYPLQTCRLRQLILPLGMGKWAGTFIPSA